MIVLGVVFLGFLGLLVLGETLPEKKEPALKPVPASLYRTGSGCVAFDPPRSWRKTLAYPKGGTGFTVGGDSDLKDDPEPGQSGVFVMLDCAPLDKVGGSGSIKIPGARTVQDQNVRLRDGQGQLTAYVFSAGGGLPAMETVQVTIDVRGDRCSLHVAGSQADVDQVRDQVDQAWRSMRCIGARH